MNNRIASAPVPVVSTDRPARSSYRRSTSRISRPSSTTSTVGMSHPLWPGGANASERMVESTDVTDLKAGDRRQSHR